MAKLNLNRLMIEGEPFIDAFDLCNKNYLKPEWNVTDIRLYEDKVLRFTVNLESDFSLVQGYVYIIRKEDKNYSLYLTNTRDHIRLISPNIPADKLSDELNNQIIPIIFKP